MRVLTYGFPYSGDAAAAVADALVEGGAEPVAWVVHNNRIGRLASALSARGIPLLGENPGPGEVERRRSSTARPVLDAQAVEDLRYLADREARFDHEWSRSLLIERVNAHVHRLLVDAAPDLVLFGDVPHSLASYLLYLWARSLGVATAVLRYGPTPYHVSYVDRIDVPLVDVVGAIGSGSGASESSELHLRTLVGTYDDAMPAYMRERAGAWANVRLAAARVAAADPGRSVRSAAGIVERTRLRRCYERLTTPAAELARVDGPCVAVFLHLQPERTTVPEGGSYAQQWRVVQDLARSVPEGTSILVREHPSTFRIGARLVREPAMYEALMAMPGVALVPLEVSPFALADRADWVATVTGTIGFETAARSGRALVFGNAAYSGCPGTVRADQTDLGPDLFLDPPPPCDLVAVTTFLARFDGSPRCWVAPWDPQVDIRALQAAGTPFPPLVRALLDDPLVSPAASPR